MAGIKKVDSLTAVAKKDLTYTKEYAGVMANNLVENMLNADKLSAIDVLNNIKLYQEAFKIAEPIVRQQAIDEARVTYRDEIINDKPFTHNGVKYVVKEVSSVNYEDDPEWMAYERDLVALKEQRDLIIQDAVKQIDLKIMEIRKNQEIREGYINGNGELPRSYEWKVTVSLPKK